MKKILLLKFLFLTLCFRLSAQEIPNVGFEEWVQTWTIDSQLVEDPENWFTSNSWYDSSVLKTTDSFSGNFSAELVVPNVTFMPDYFCSTGNWVDAMLYSSYLTTSATSLKAYVKCDSISGYSKVGISVYGNSQSYHSNIIGGWYSETIVSNYTLIEIPFDNNIAHDSIKIIIFTSVPKSQDGNLLGFANLKVDDIKLIGNEKNVGDLKIYPNPTTDKLEITSKENIISIELFDLQGRQVLVDEINNSSFIIDVSRLQIGQYLLRMRTKNKVVTEKVEKL